MRTHFLLVIALPMVSLPALAQQELIPTAACEQRELIPIAAWSFNRCSQDLSEGHVLDGSGQRIDPIEGKPNHLTANGASCASLAGREGRFGDAGWFAGGPPAESRVTVPLGDRFTVSAWVYPIPFAGDLGVVSGGGGSYALAYNRALNGGQGGFHFEYGGVSIDSKPAPLGNWHHVAAVVGPDPACAGQVRLRVYVDAAPDAGPTACAPTGNLRETAVVGRGFRGRIDEVTLYPTSMDQAQVSDLFGIPKPVYLGADTSARPECGDYPKNAQGTRNPLGYDFYLGRLAVGTEACTIKTFSGHDIVTGAEVPDPPGCIAFQMFAAAVARPQRSYGFVLLLGPNSRPGDVPNDRAYGAAQADALATQRDRYLHVVYGKTLFADIEDLLNSGWDTACKSGSVSACARNQDVLEGFLEQAIASGFTAGVYTNLEIWNDAFGVSYIPGANFVAWITSWNTSDDGSGMPSGGKNVDVESLREFEQNALDGMQGVLWQYTVNRPADFDATRQDPTVRFVPRSADNPPEAPTNLTATADADTLRDRWIQLRWDRVRKRRLTYNVYRAPRSPVPIDRSHQIASGLRERRYRDNSVNWEITYFYVVTAVDGGGTSSPPSGEAIARLVLFDNVQVAPNPFTPGGDGLDDVTTIAYTLSLPPQERRVSASAEILDPGGNLVQRLRVRPPLQGRGRHSVTWDGRRRDGSLASVGVYTFRITARSIGGRPRVVVRRSGEVQLARGPDWIDLSYFYSFGDLSGTATVLPGDRFTISNAPGGCGPIFRDIAECQTNSLRQIRAYNHDCLSGDEPGTFGPWVSEGCSAAEEFGFVVECCVLP